MIADKITDWIGSWPFIVASVVGVLAWFLLKAEPFPPDRLDVFIYLTSYFFLLVILKNQNDQDRETIRREEADLATDKETLRLLKELVNKP